jgi:CRISPR-associated autoregulator DevR family
MNENKLTHIAGTFLIQADAAFLNGGQGKGEDRNVTIPKTFRDGKNEVPYVSAQAWKRWLRNTLIEETDWRASEIKAIGWNKKGNVSKIAAELNPVDFVEDDIFGYMKSEGGQGRRITEEDDEPEGENENESVNEEINKGRTKSVIRSSPFMASLLISLRLNGWNGQDEGFVHLEKYNPQALGEADIERFLLVVSDKKKDKKKSIWDRLKEFDNEFGSKVKQHSDRGELNELRNLLFEKAKEKKKELNFIENPCSPLPYVTRFYNTHLQGIFCLDYSRLGVYWNLGDRIELEESKAKKLIGEGKVVNVTSEEPYKTLSENGKIGNVYRITDKVMPTPKERASALFKALALLRGGAKQAQFGTDVSPKVIVLAGLTCGNPIFNHLFKDEQEGPVFKIETFKEILKDYADRINTPVLIGLRSGYLKNEVDVKALNAIKVTKGDGVNKSEVEILVMTPIEASQKIGDYLL